MVNFDNAKKLAGVFMDYAPFLQNFILSKRIDKKEVAEAGSVGAKKASSSEPDRSVSFGGVGNKDNEINTSAAINSLPPELQYVIEEFILWLIGKHPLKAIGFDGHISAEYEKSVDNALKKLTDLAELGYRKGLRPGVEDNIKNSILEEMVRYCDARGYLSDRLTQGIGSLLSVGKGKLAEFCKTAEPTLEETEQLNRKKKDFTNFLRNRRR